jgi:hypothetical protein
MTDMKFGFLLCMLFFFSSCIFSTWDTRLALINETDQKIRYRFELKEKDNYGPDTTYCDMGELYEVLPNSTVILNGQDKWDVYFKRHPDDYLRVYIINEDSLKKYGKCGVLKGRIIMKRYDLNYDDMERLNWRIEYK